MSAINWKTLKRKVNYSFLEDCTDLPSLVLLQQGLGHAGGQTGAGAAAHIGGQGGMGGIIGGIIGGAGC